MHPANAPAPTSAHDSGTSARLSDVHPANAPAPIRSSPGGRTTERSDGFAQNEPALSARTLDGTRKFPSSLSLGYATSSAPRRE